MRFTTFVHQNVPWLDIAMQNAVLMRVVNRARDFGNEFHGAPDRHWFALEDRIELFALDQSHAEVASAVAFANFIDRNNPWMVQACSGLRLASKAFQVRCGGPRTQADYLQRDGPIETFLVG